MWVNFTISLFTLKIIIYYKPSVLQLYTNTLYYKTIIILSQNYQISKRTLNNKHTFRKSYYFSKQKAHSKFK